MAIRGAGANPVSAFLAGFSAVDSLETNRQYRKSLADQDSRMRQMWKREDDAYTRQQLDKYRNDKLVEFNATTEQITNEVAVKRK